MYEFVSDIENRFVCYSTWRRAFGRALIGLTLLGASVHVAPALAADATFTNLGAGVYNTVQGSTDGDPVEIFSYVGTFDISIDGGAPTAAYCVDIHNGISIGDSEPQSAPDYPCQVGYILSNAFPNASAIPTPLADVNREAAAVQSAIWNFTDGFTITAPADIVSRTAQIVAAAASQCAEVPAVPQTLTLSPADAINYLPEDTTHSVTATLLDTYGAPLGDYALDIVVTGAAGPQILHGTTNAQGQLTVDYTNPFAVSGTDTITASASFTVPLGLEFKREGLQGIVVAGGPQPGTVTATASKHWVPAACGDGVVDQAGEQCDDGNQNDGDGCDSNCTPTSCGNGVVTAGEQCDDGNLLDGDGCDSNCTPTSCGNGVVTIGEQCDDGNRTNGDACDNNCTTPRCGNGIVTAGEQCDDGNETDGDGCDSNCTLTACGNGVVTAGEQCDDGNTMNGDACGANCTLPGCGNHIVDAGEQCDDGNVTDGDGCDSNCTLTGCGNHILTPGEECDDGNTADGDGCEADCTLSRCGNGIVDRGEQCDDGNFVDGDGCSPACRLQETCGDLVDNDGNGAIDCDDVACTCQPILEDPALIKVIPQGPDHFKIHGTLIPLTAFDPVADGLSIVVTNANGPIYKAVLLPGDLTQRGARFTFRDPAARRGQGSRGGLYKVKLSEYRLGRVQVFIEAFGDFSAATLPAMTTQIGIGNDLFFNKGDWTRTRSGWRLRF